MTTNSYLHAPAPSTSEPAEVRYEHRIWRKHPNVVQVRPVRRKGQPRADWATYMALETPDDAQRILWLLYNRHTVVTP